MVEFDNLIKKLTNTNAHTGGNLTSIWNKGNRIGFTSVSADKGDLPCFTTF